MAVPKFRSNLLARAVLYLFSVYGDTPHNRAAAVLLLFGAIDIKECLECTTCHNVKVLK